MTSNNELNQAFLRDLLVFFLLFAMLFGAAIAAFSVLASGLAAFL